MIRTGPIAEPPRASASLRLLTAARWICLGLFVASVVLVAAETLGAIRLPEKTGWPEAALVLSAAGTTLLSLSRQLPGQNVLLAAAVIGLIGGFAHTLSALRAIPFGPCLFTSAAGPRLLDTLPWWVPLVWIVAILNSRGVAQLILRPWRKTRIYGFRLIGLTVVLALVFDLGLEPFATRVHGFCLWEPTRLNLNWCGTPLTNFLGWIATALLILAFAMPALINKKPVEFPPDYQPLIVWTLVNLLFATGAAAHQLWFAAMLGLGATLAAAALAVRGPRR